MDNNIRRKSFALNNLLRHSFSFTEPIILNPFIHSFRLPWYEWIKIILMSITVAPIRGIMILLSIVGIVFFGCIASIGISQETLEKSLPAWRKLFRFFARRFFRLAFFFTGFQYIEIKGRRCSPNEAMIQVVAPHSTFMDVILLVCGRTVSGISKIENSRIPLLGYVATMLQPIWVDRLSADSRQDTINRLTARADTSNGHKGLPQIIVFPEGTTTNRTCLINFKAGAFVPGKPIQPVILKYPNRVDCFTWTHKGPSVIFQFWVMLCQFHNRIIVEYLPVYSPSEQEKSDSKLYSVNVRNMMARYLELPSTDHSYEDCRLMTLAEKLKLPQASGIVEFSKLSRQLKINFTGVTNLLSQFADISESEIGKISLEAFADYLGLPPTDEVKKVFSMYDRSNTGFIDFREYVIGLSLVAMPATQEDTLKISFKIMDPEMKGKLTREEFSGAMIAAFGMDEISSQRLFVEMDVDHTGYINYDKFMEYGKKRPEFTKVISLYQEYHNQVKQRKTQTQNSIYEKFL